MASLRRVRSVFRSGAVTTVEQRESRRFAPIRLPMRRRLQTMAVLWHTISISVCLSLFFFLCAVPILWPVIAVYLIWLFTDESAENGSRKAQAWVRKLKVFRWFCQYFPIRLHRSVPLDPQKKYIFGYHPHGIISAGAFGGFGTDGAGFSTLFPGLYVSVLTISTNFFIPIYRDYLQSLGIASVSRQSCEKLLAKGPGSAILIVVGGATESLAARPGRVNLVINKRKGFVRMAFTTGACLVPCLAFGENDVYQQLENRPDSKLFKFQSFFKKIAGFTLPLFHGRGALNYDFGLLPWRKPINIVVGRPIEVEQNAKPAPEEVDRVHQLYINELEKIWGEWKQDFAPDRLQDMNFIM